LAAISRKGELEMSMYYESRPDISKAEFFDGRLEKHGIEVVKNDDGDFRLILNKSTVVVWSTTDNEITSFTHYFGNGENGDPDEIFQIICNVFGVDIGTVEFYSMFCPDDNAQSEAA
jgi:hypothetical protein